MLESAADAAASFRQLAAILQSSRRGRAERHALRRNMWIACGVTETAAALNGFEPVTASDLSASGFSFFSPFFLTKKELVVRLGASVDGAIVLTAKVVWQSLIGEDGPECVKVGCQFVRRL